MRTPKTPGSVFSPNIWLGHNADPRRQSFGTNILRLNIHFCVTRDPTFDPVTYTPRDQLIHEYQFLQRVVNPDTVTVLQLKELALQTWEKVEKESGKRHRVRADRIKQLDIRNADNSTIPTDLTVVDAFDDRERLHVLALVESSATIEDIFDATHHEDTSVADISSDNITFEHINDIGNSNDKKRRRSLMDVDDEIESHQANGAVADLKATSNSKVAHAIKRRRHEENATEEDDDTSFLRDESYLQESHQLLSPLLLPEDVHRMTRTSTLDDTTSSQLLKSTGASLPTGNIVGGANIAVTDGISKNSTPDSEDGQNSDAASNASQEDDVSSGSEVERADEEGEAAEDASATATRAELEGLGVEDAQSDTSEDGDDESDDEQGGTPLESETTRPANSKAAIELKESVSAPSPSESESESESEADESESESNSQPETETPEQAATDFNTKPLNTTSMHHHVDSESEDEDDLEDQSDGHLAQVSPPATDRTPALSNIESGEDSDDDKTEDNSDEENDVEEDAESTVAESDDVTSTPNNVSSEPDDRASVRVQELAAASTTASPVQSKQAVAMMSPPDSPLGRNKTQSNAVKPAIESSRRHNKSASRVTATPVTESPQHSEAELSDDEQASPNLLSQSQSSPPFKFQSQSKTSSQRHKSSTSFDSLSGLTQAATAGNPLSAAMRLSAAHRSRNWSSLSELSANPSEFSFSQSQVSQQLLPVDSDTHGEDSDEEDEEDEERERSDSSGDSDSSDDEDSDNNGHPVRLAGKKRRKRKSAFLDLAADVERPVKRAQARQGSVPLSQQSQTNSNARLFRLFFSQPLPSTSAKAGKSAKVVRKPLLSQIPHQRRTSKPISTEALRRSAKEARDSRTREELARELDGEESD